MAYIGLDEIPDLLRDAERIRSVAGRGEAGGGGAEEALARATMCYYRREHERAAVLFEKGFAADPSLLADAHDRFHAACSAAMAGPEWTPKALAWLRTSLEALRQTVAKGDEGDAIDARWVLGNWRLSRFLKPVRDTVALARMPDEERTAWLDFWADADALDASTRKEKY